MAWFERKAEYSEASLAVAPGPLPRSMPQVANAQVDHYENFSDVPEFKRILSIGAGPITLSKDERENVVVGEATGRVALIVHAQADQVQLESLKGKLRTGAFSTIKVVTAPTKVIEQIYKEHSEQADANRIRGGGNEYLQTAFEWIEYAVAHRATDIHIETRGLTGWVRFRVDGDLAPMRAANGGRYPASFIQDCMASLYNEQQTKSGSATTFEAGSFRYCMIPYAEVPGRKLKLRFQSFRGNEGPKAVLRLLPVDELQKTKTFEELGYAPSHVGLWHEAMQTPSGLCLVAGVTGSGKSTTLKTFVELNPHLDQSAVYTVEDPVEYPIRGAHQIPIQRDLADPLKSSAAYGEVAGGLVRGDLDIVMVGEIRDRISSNAAQQLTEAGGMALGTLHAHLLSGIVPRLVNTEIGMTRQTLTGPNMLTVLAYQALVPLLCSHCAMDTAEAVRDDSVVADIARHLDQIRVDSAPMRWKRIGGCTHCDSRGTVGLTVVAEMLMPDEDWLKPVREGRDHEAVEVYRSMSDGDLSSPDMTGKSVFEHTLFKAQSGNVDARQCSRFDIWSRFVRRVASRRSV